MYRLINFVVCLSAMAFLGGCKKDLLHWKQVQQLDSHTDSKLNRMQFISDSVCVIGGGIHYEKAEVLRSTDGGYTWANYSYPDAGKGMYGMCVSPQGIIYMCGTDGTVLRSADSGASFQFNRIDDWAYYVGVAYPTPDTGFFAYTHLNDAGAITRVDANYKIIDKTSFNFGLDNIYMKNRDTGYVVGYGAVMKTWDGGAHWHYLDPKGDKFTCMDIHGDELWVCGFAGSVYHSTDAGVHWSRIRNGNDLKLPRLRMLSIVFKDSRTGWASCDDGTVVYTEDGGEHWLEYDRFTTQALRTIIFCPNGDLLTCGDNGALYRLTIR